MVLRYSIVFLILSVSHAFADDAYDRCVKESDSTSVAFQQCGVEWILREERRLNEVWKAVYAVAIGRTRADLLNEQRAWIVYKDKSCEFYANSDYGSQGRVLNYPNCRARVLGQRTKELAEFGVFLKHL